MVRGKELAEQENWKIIQEERVSLVAQWERTRLPM